MLKHVGRWVGSGIGYLLYGVVVLALLLWLLFPQETLHRSLEAELGRIWPEMRWRIGTIAVAMPPSLVVRDVEGYGQGDEKKALVRIDRVTVNLHPFQSLRTQRLEAGYRIEIGKGSVIGLLWKILGSGNLHVEGTIQGIDLADIVFIRQQLGRTLHGSVSGNFTVGVPQGSASTSLEAHVMVENGRVGLKQPILSHSELPFSSATATLHGRGEILQVEQGTIESELLDSRYSGTIRLHHNLMFSEINIQGDMQPKNKFFKGVSNTLAFEAFRLQLKDNTLPFKISGSLVDPGIHYQEYAILFQKLEKELH